MSHKRADAVADPKACAIYARYSSLAQRDQSIEDQVDACRAWAEARGLYVAEVYADRHISGTTDARPAFQRMVADAERGEWTTLVVYKVDRFARDRTDAAVYKRRLRRCGVTVASAMESIPDGPEGVVLESILDGFAEYYSKNLSQNVMRGMRSNAERCMVNGVCTYGYRPGPDGRYEICEEEAEVVREAFDRRLRGHGPSAIREWLAGLGVTTRRGGEPSYYMVRSMLTNERYIGTYTWGGVRVEGGIPAIVDEDVFWRVQRLMGTRGKSKVYRLSGMLRDAATGAPYRGESATGSTGRTYYYYSFVDADGSVVRVPCAPVEDAVEEAVAQVVSDPALVRDIAAAAAKVAVEEAHRGGAMYAHERLAEIGEETARIAEAVVGGVPASVLADKARLLERERASLEAKLGRMEAELPTAADIEGFLAESLSVYLEDFDLTTCVDSVTLYRDGGFVDVTFAWGSDKAVTMPENARTPCSEGVREIEFGSPYQIRTGDLRLERAAS